MMAYKNVYDNRSMWAKYKFFWLLLIILFALGTAYFSYQYYTIYQYTHAPINKPNMPDEVVEQWAIQATEKAYKYNYKNVEIVLPKLKRYFTQPGWNAFEQAVKGSGNLQALNQNKFTVSAQVLADKIQLTDKGYDKELHSYAWQFVLPMIIQYQSKEKTLKQPVEAYITIVRVPKTPENQGIAINTFIVKADGGDT
jgi:hypothetical protein